MPYNGSGVFLRIRNWVNDAAAGIKIRADRHDSEDDNFALGLTQCITKDGQTTITANLPMSGFKHTNVATATSLNQYARYDQSANGLANWGVATGTADAIEVNNTIPFTALVDGLIVNFRASATTTITTPTLSLDTLTAKTIVKFGDIALGVGEIVEDQEVTLRYNADLDKFVLVGSIPTDITVNNITAGSSAGLALKNSGGTTVITVGAGNGINTTIAENILVTGSSSSAGHIILREDTDNGTNSVSIYAPASVTSDRTLTLPDDDGTIATQEYVTAQGFSKIQNLTNQSPTSGTSISFVDIPAGTKRVTIQFAGLTMSGASDLYIQIGDSGGLETTGYVSNSVRQAGGAAIYSNRTDGFNLEVGIANFTLRGTVTLTRVGNTNTWVCEALLVPPIASVNQFVVSTGEKTLSGELTQLSINVVSAVTFASGLVGVMYE